MEVVGAIAGVALLVVWFAGFADWKRMVMWLIYFQPFVGIPVLLSGHNPLALLAKDLLFFFPMYISLFMLHAKDMKNIHVPSPISLSMGLFAFIVLIQCLNPTIPNIFVGVLGAKVWLLYMPLLYAANAMINSSEDHIRVLRIMSAIAVIPAAIGLMEWFFAAAFGYQAIMDQIYGTEAMNVTQGYATFNYGGDFYRIPSTFPFTSQYYAFLQAMLVTGFILKSVDPDPKWRKYASLIFYFILSATFLSGSRGSYVFAPMLLGMMYLFDARVKGFLAGAVIVPIMVFGVLSLGGIDPIAMLTETSTLTGNYSGQFVLDSPIRALEYVPWGMGTGMNTGAARYLFPGGQLPSYSLPFNVESYYTKAIVELGIPGLLSMFLMYGLLTVGGFTIRHRCRDRGLKTAAAAYTVFIVYMAISNVKGWEMDFDPINVYFWLFNGFLFKLPYLEPARVPILKTQPRLPRGPAYGYRMPPAMARRPTPRRPE